MTVKGTVRNGVVVLRESAEIPEGAEVEVEYTPPQMPALDRRVRRCRRRVAARSVEQP